MKWLIPLLGVAAATAFGRVMDLNPTSAGFAFIIVVLLSSLRAGLLGGTVASVLATLCYNFFFFPPVHSFTIHDQDNWVALTVFLLTSVIVSRLVIAARTQAETAEQRQNELEVLYAERERFIAETAHLEALRESEALKTSLLRAISHDLTTPLTAIMIHTEALKRRVRTDDELRESVLGIAGETARLRRRIDNLLAMARLEAGKAEPRPEPTPPADLFRAARENLPLVFQSRNIRVRVSDDCPDVNVDPSLVLEILVNLIENADRVSPPDTPLDLVAQRHALDASQVSIELLDRGPGVPLSSDAAQSGLGLQIARSMAAASGGSVEIMPREGGGSIARVDLPAAMLPIGQETV